MMKKVIYYLLHCLLALFTNKFGRREQKRVKVTQSDNVSLSLSTLSRVSSGLISFTLALGNLFFPYVNCRTACILASSIYILNPYFYRIGR